MNKKLIIIMLLSLLGGMAWAQSPEAAPAGTGTLSMTFTSETEVKFFIYVNGKLQNPQSTGRYTVDKLEDKPYHIRIVMDDPFEVAVTRTMRPGKSPTEYAVRFNPVRERVYLSLSREKVAEESWYGNGGNGGSSRSSSATAADKSKSKRLSRKERAAAAELQGTTGKEMKTTKTPYLEEE